MDVTTFIEGAAAAENLLAVLFSYRCRDLDVCHNEMAEALLKPNIDDIFGGIDHKSSFVFILGLGLRIGTSSSLRAPCYAGSRCNEMKR